MPGTAAAAILLCRLVALRPAVAVVAPDATRTEAAPPVDACAVRFEATMTTLVALALPEALALKLFSFSVAVPPTLTEAAA